MEDSGEDLEMLTRALVETIKQLADPGQDQKEVLEKTTTGLFVSERTFRGKLCYRVLPAEKFAVKFYSEYEFLAAEN